MNANDEELVARKLGRLATHAPRYRGLPPAAANDRRRRYVAPLLATACVVAISVFVGTLASRGPDQPPATSSPNAPAGSTTAPSSGAPTEFPMRLDKAASWPHLKVSTCAAWKPSDGDSVVQVDDLDDSCVLKAPRSSTTVVIAPYDGGGIFGVGWRDVTVPWREVGGHPIARLSSGPLMEMSSRFVDAVVCETCDQVILVLGPDPSTVRGLIESLDE